MTVGALGGLRGNNLSATAKVKSSLRSSDQRQSQTYSGDDQQSMRSGSKTESAYEDDFESMSKSHLSMSRGAGSRGGNRMSSASESMTLDPQKGPEMTAKKAASATTKNFSQKRKSAEGLTEKYSPIKEAAKHKEEHSLEDERAGSDDDEDYTSAEASESTMKYKYGNATHGGSGSKSKLVPGVEDSMASSSAMMSSSGIQD